MRQPVNWTDEDKAQLAFLQTPVGEADGGRVRYAAAMHFARQHLLSPAALEVYRILAKEDATDPRNVLARENLATELDRLLTGPHA